MRMIVRFAPHLKLRLGEWLASVILFSMGVVLLVWPHIFAEPTYSVMRLGFGLSGWTLVFILSGGIRLVALWVNGRKSITPYIRMVMAFFSCFVWWQVTVSFFLSGVPALVWGVFPWLLALEMYNVFQASDDAREVFDNKRASQDGKIV